MMPSSPRVKYWRDKFQAGETLFTAACASASEAEACLAMAPDLIVFHPGFPKGHSPGETGMLGALEPMGNANEAAALGFLPLPSLCAPCPVAMGICGTDPFLLPISAFPAWRKSGLEGIANYPTIGLTDGLFRSDLESTGFGIAQEIDCLRKAHEAGFFTLGFVSRPQEAAAFAEAGCDALVLHLGLTPDFTPRPLAKSLEDVWEQYLAALGSRGPLLLLHGEHLVDADDDAAWMSSVRESAGLFAMGGLERIITLRALTGKQNSKR
ncbi:MAG: phosphoenolpyruvate hydrolase family protein [Fibrobacteria bacterium]